MYKFNQPVSIGYAIHLPRKAKPQLRRINPKKSSRRSPEEHTFSKNLNAKATKLNAKTAKAPLLELTPA
jgi:hypothetical protein